MQVLSRRVDSRVSVPRFRSLIAFSNRLVRIACFETDFAERIQRIRAFPFINCNGALIPCDDFGDVFFLCRCLDDEVRRVHTSRRYRNLFVEQLEELRSIRALHHRRLHRHFAQAIPNHVRSCFRFGLFLYVNAHFFSSSSSRSSS